MPPSCPLHLLRHRLELAAHLGQFSDHAHQRDHDLRLELDAVLRHVGRRLKNRAGLHHVDFGEDQPQTAAAQAEHRVHLAHARDGLEQLALLSSSWWIFAAILQPCHLDQRIFIARQELMQRRVDQTDDDGIALAGLWVHHRAEDALEVRALEGEELIELRLALLRRLRQNHFLDDGQTLLLHEHMLGAAEADTLRAELDGSLGVARIVGVGPDAQPAHLVGPIQQRVQVMLGVVIRLR